MPPWAEQERWLRGRCAINTRPFKLSGGIAQLGERRVRIAKARGSNPLTSTTIAPFCRHA